MGQNDAFIGGSFVWSISCRQTVAGWHRRRRDRHAASVLLLPGEPSKHLYVCMHNDRLAGLWAFHWNQQQVGCTIDTFVSHARFTLHVFVETRTSCLDRAPRSKSILVSPSSCIIMHWLCMTRDWCISSVNDNKRNKNFQPTLDIHCF